ncbi:hypothetical protein [Nocardia sp. CS682]|uniref:hypothetical protein n=1 Tax=Nocardia sp. CS682 TaxID=1047172 RepID=UPI0010751CCD|nr:hypothetical protein [Nocardia sp. CS682]
MMRKLLLGGGAALSIALAGLVIVGSCDGDTATQHGSDAAVRLAHGPTGVHDGVPIGYTRDREGAATAAVNTVQALTQAGQGRIALDAVQGALLARDPGPRLRTSMRIGLDRTPSADVVNLVPAAVSVTALTPSSARVMVWTVAVSRSAIAEGAPVSVVTAWATHTVELVWERGDWKAKEATGHVGPSPEEVVAPGADSPLTQPLQSGYYTVYIN